MPSALPSLTVDGQERHFQAADTQMCISRAHPKIEDERPQFNVHSHLAAWALALTSRNQLGSHMIVTGYFLG